MQLTITLDGSESDKHLEKISYAINLLRSDIDITVIGRPAPTPPIHLNLSTVSDSKAIAEQIEKRTAHAEPAESFEADVRAAESAVATREALERPIPPLPPKPPVAPMPAAAPTSTSVPEAPSVTSVALDGDGLPWDERIHSSNQKLNANGKWWAKRNVSAELATSVTAELRALTGDTLDPATLFTTQELAESAAPTPPLPPVVTGLTFQGLVAKIVEKKLDFQQIAEFLKLAGVSPSNLPTLSVLAAKDPSILGAVATVMGIQ